MSFDNPYAPPTQAGGGVTPPASITGAGAFTPDWASLIQNDTGLKDAQAALNSGSVADAASRNSAIANAYESFGGTSTDLAALAKQLGMSVQDLTEALGPDVQKLAQENTQAGLSTQARLDQQNKTAVRQILANLNKRGLLHSGETGYQLDQENLGYRQAQSDAYQKFLGYLQQYQSGYLAAQNARAQTLAQSYSDAANRAVTTNQSSPGVTANYDHTDASGNHVYRGPDGQLYNQDGSIYTPPSAAPTPAPMQASPSAADVGYQQTPRVGTTFAAG